jgi:hypothetical protein
MEHETTWILGLLAGSGGVIAYLFRMLITAKKEKYDLLLAEKERQNKELESAKNSMKEIASEAVRSYLATANHYRQKEGMPPIVPLVPVVAESQSPPTKEQREAAEIATMRAKMAQINMAVGIAPPREEPGAAAPATVDDASLATKGDVIRLEANIAAVPDKVADKVVDKLEEGKS